MELTQRRRGAALCLALLLLATLLAPLAPASARPISPRQGLSRRQKLVMLGGAALLYYLYKRHQARRATTAGERTPQLYRSRNGGIYYRDPQGRPVWLTVPSQGLEVPYADVQRYAPDYRRYRGPAPAVPQSSRSESFRSWLDALPGGSTL